MKKFIFAVFTAAFFISGCSYEDEKSDEVQSKLIEMETQVKQLKIENSKLKAENAKLLKDIRLIQKSKHDTKE
ncbi:hypothetical protein [Metabacillus idriensis]|uniref:hypothetical protein n=1 Tax=Metabacillus idriensis TaxID=324768 RepID=UPI00174B0883|nr:hypothetical protein [Metabacillus idriensis]